MNFNDFIIQYREDDYFDRLEKQKQKLKQTKDEVDSLLDVVRQIVSDKPEYTPTPPPIVEAPKWNPGETCPLNERVLVVSVRNGEPSEVQIATKIANGWDFGYHYEFDSEGASYYWQPIPKFTLPTTNILNSAVNIQGTSAINCPKKNFIFRPIL